MKLALFALALVAAAVAAPAAIEDAKAVVIRSDFDQQPEGAYNFNFESDNGISRQETGEVKEVLNEENKPQLVVVVRGSYTYTDTEGKPNTITYFADESGYHAEGESIPKPARR